MPRKRTSSEPPKERAKLDSAEQVNNEVKRLYRRFSNKQISASELKSRVAALQVLRAGLSDPVEIDPAAGPFVDTINIIAIPAEWSVISLLGDEAHMPFETVQQLKQLLPPGSVHRSPSLNSALPPPLDAPLPHAPMLRVYDGGDVEQDPEPPEAA